MPPFSCSTRKMVGVRTASFRISCQAYHGIPQGCRITGFDKHTSIVIFHYIPDHPIDLTKDRIPAGHNIKDLVRVGRLKHIEFFQDRQAGVFRRHHGSDPVLRDRRNEQHIFKTAFGYKRFQAGFVLSASDKNEADLRMLPFPVSSCFVYLRF